jgi:hypothetical protein
MKRTNEAVAVHGGANHRHPERAGGRRAGGGAVSQARHERCDILQLEEQVRRAGGQRGEAARALEAENARLKRLLADAMLDDAALKDLLGKKW